MTLTTCPLMLVPIVVFMILKQLLNVTKKTVINGFATEKA
jgi:hypothetical protein